MAYAQKPKTMRDQENLLGECGSMPRLHVTREVTSNSFLRTVVIPVSTFLIAFAALSFASVLYYQIHYTDLVKCTCERNVNQEDSGSNHLGQPQQLPSINAPEDPYNIALDSLQVQDEAYIDEDVEGPGADEEDDEEEEEEEEGEEEDDREMLYAEEEAVLSYRNGQEAGVRKTNNFGFYPEPVRKRRSARGSGDNNDRRHKNKKAGKRGGKTITCKVFANKDGQLQLKTSKNKDPSDKCHRAMDNYMESKSQRRNAAIQVEANIQGVDLAALANGSVPMENYQGVMYYQGFVPGNETMAFWTMTNWSKENEATQETYEFHRQQGAIEVKKAGLYYVYAQVIFHTTRAHVGYHVTKTDATKDPLLTCITGVDDVSQDVGALDPDRVTKKDRAKYKSCPTHAILTLRKGDKIQTRLIEKGIKVSTGSSHSFWGIIKIH